MKNVKFERSKDKVLVVSGCSHTQGSAFVRKITKPIVKKKKELYELATPQLKSMYKKDYVSADFISNNLTWGGKLAKLCRADKFYNLGFGGFGIESVIRALRNYAYKVDDLKNHLFVIQVPSSSRKEVFVVEEGYVRRDGIKNVARTAAADPFGFMPADEVKMNFVTNFFDADVTEVELYYELYALQNLLESKGANVRMFIAPFTKLEIENTLQVKKYEDTLKNWDQVSFYDDLHKAPSFLDMFNSLNIIETENLPTYRTNLMKNPKQWTLHSDGTVPGDQHYNEDGNFALANCIKENLNKRAKLQKLEQIVTMEVEGEEVVKTLI